MTNPLLKAKPTSRLHAGTISLNPKRTLGISILKRTRSLLNTLKMVRSAEYAKRNGASSAPRLSADDAFALRTE